MRQCLPWYKERYTKNKCRKDGNKNRLLYLFGWIPPGKNTETEFG